MDSEQKKCADLEHSSEDANISVVDNNGDDRLDEMLSALASVIVDEIIALKGEGMSATEIGASYSEDVEMAL